MLLTELTGVKRFHNKDQWQLRKLLSRFGITWLDKAGQYGSVWTHPSWDYVVKVFDDPLYLGFVDFALKHPNKHFPKFKKKPITMHMVHTRDKQAPNKMTVVKVEKLNPITDRKLMGFIIRNIEEGAVALSRKVPQENKNYKYKWLDMPNGEAAQNVSYYDLFKQHPWFKSLCGAYLLLMNSGLPGVLDLHAGNFMQRDDGTIVFIDPFWAGENPYQAYDRMRRAESGWDDYDPPQVSGPDYAQKKQQPEPAEQLAHAIADDDIPF